MKHLSISSSASKTRKRKNKKTHNNQLIRNVCILTNYYENDNYVTPPPMWPKSDVNKIYNRGPILLDDTKIYNRGPIWLDSKIYNTELAHSQDYMEPNVCQDSDSGTDEGDNTTNCNNYTKIYNTEPTVLEDNREHSLNPRDNSSDVGQDNECNTETNRTPALPPGLVELFKSVIEIRKTLSDNWDKTTKILAAVAPIRKSRCSGC